MDDWLLHLIMWHETTKPFETDDEDETEESEETV